MPKHIPSKIATLCFLIDGDNVLLAMKKRGFGAGKWNGYGGKVEAGESLIETAMRETQEEIGVKPKDLSYVGIINFYFGKKYNKWWQVHIYLSKKWIGKPKKSEEMLPKWFAIKDIPYDEMWAADRRWIPEILAGHTITAEILFDETGDTFQSINIKQVKAL